MERSNYDVRMYLSPNPIKRGRRRCTLNGCLATRVLTGTHVAVARHLLTAVHFSLRHRSVGQAGQGRHRHREQDQTERENGATQCHKEIVHR